MDRNGLDGTAFQKPGDCGLNAEQDGQADWYGQNIAHYCGF